MWTFLIIPTIFMSQQLFVQQLKRGKQVVGYVTDIFTYEDNVSFTVKSYDYSLWEKSL